ncbi:MAG TPA: TonB-dependent receptor [Asticcacaulis sp.]|nr:TonB-dependent receptor [Asticcacaulis sp.]
MTVSHRSGLRAALLATSVLGLTAAPHAFAQDNAATDSQAAADAPSAEIVVKLNKTTRSSVELGGGELQKILPGINPLKAIQTLPGVLFETADPWGNNEQNETLFVHGFSLQQLGYTFDGVPLGDQQYGNWNGLSPSRAVISENVSRVQFASGAADLGVASTSNLGGSIETFSSDPAKAFGFTAAETLGSYETDRTYLRLDSGEFGNGNSLYVSALHHDAKAWDFNGHQRDDQLNAKYVHTGAKGRFTAYLDYQKKVEPNEDSIVHPQTGTSATMATADLNVPYTRPFLYPDYNAALAYLNPATGAPPAADGNNFRNYHSAAQREDVLAYAKYDYKFNDSMSWSNQVYYHYNYGRGIVAGPINQAGLPGLFAVYYPGPAGETAADQALRLKAIFGGTGWAVRTTEYLQNRAGLISTFKWQLGDHNLEAGLWYEKEFSTQHRAWYPFTIANNDLSPYDIPVGKNFNQYYGRFNDMVLNFHVQDQWHVTPTLTLQYGFKSSSQTGSGFFPINQLNAPTATSPVHFPTGTIKTDEGFLPQVGLVWDATPNDQIFVDAQKNVRHFIVYGAGGSAWSLSNQAAFDLFKSTVKPETSSTYEAGWRFHHNFDGPISGFEGQISAYHVDFQNRLLSISPTPVILSLVAGAAVLANVGDVKTDGVDLAGTLHLGKHWSMYDAVSYNKSVYQNDYMSGTTTVPTAGKQVPASPDWMNKFILSANYGQFDMQLSGDYVGKRFATYTNDLWVKGYFLTGLQMGYRFNLPASSPVKYAKLSLNITNLGDIKTTSTLVVGAAAGTYNTYPMPPRMTFVTLTTKF